MTAQKKGDGAVILGMHRSGTSALTRVVNLLGYDLGTDLIDSAADNPKGYWEDRHVVFINDLILQKLNIPWWDYRKNSSVGWENRDEFRCEREFVRALVRSKIENGIPFLIKDPRICRTLPLWRMIFDELSLEVQYIEVLRNPLSVSKSLEKRGIIEGTSHQLDVDEGMRLWLRYVHETRESTKDLDVLRLLFPDMLSDRDLLLEKLDGFLDRSVISESVTQEIESFLDVGSVHQTDTVYQGDDALGIRIWDLWCSIRREISEGIACDFDRQTAEILSIADSFYSKVLSRLGPDFETKKAALVVSNLISQNQHNSEQAKRYFEQVIELKKNYSAQIKDLQRTISALRNSISWKVTSPFRTLLSPLEAANGSGHLESKITTQDELKKIQQQPFRFADASKPLVLNNTKHPGRIAYLSGTDTDFRYRCEFQADMLRHRGFDVGVFFLGNIDYGDLIHHYSHIVFQGVNYDSEIAEFCQAAVTRGLKLYYDCDDLDIREPELDSIVSRGISAVGEDSAIRDMLQLIGLCECLIMSTKSRGELWSEVFPNKRMVVSDNLIGLQFRDLCSLSGRIEQLPRDRITLGYFHKQDALDTDFDLCAPVVLSLLKQHPKLDLIMVGNVELDSLWECVADRVTHIPFIDFYTSPSIYRCLDINLAPIRDGNSFSESKSVVGYIESGIMGIPTVASASVEHSKIIRNGDNGFLCQNEHDWNSVLERLISDEHERGRIGENAKFDVIEKHSFDSPSFDDSSLIREFDEA